MFTYIKNTPVVFSTFIASITIIIAIFVGLQGLSSLRASEKTISVTGSADRIVESDSAKWTLSLVRSAEKDGLKEGNTLLQQDTKKLLEFLKNKGVEEKSIERLPIDTQSICFNQNDSNYDRNGNRICAGGGSYSMSVRVIINTEKAKEIADTSTQATEYALSQGITLSNSNVEYFYNKLADLRVDLLGEATKNAQLRAEKIVSNTGRTLGTLQSASMGVFQVTSKQSVDFSDYGSYDTSTYEKKVTAIVRTAFSIR